LAEMSGAVPDPVPSACPVCLAGQPTFYCQKQRARYFICDHCGLIFQHPLPTTESMAAWADEEYASGAYHDYVAARPMKMRHFEQRLDDIGDVGGSGRLLDVGCSCGYFMEVAKSRGFDVQGIEFSSSAIAAATPDIRTRIFQGKLEDMPDKGPFDVVSAFDLIEHVHDPRAFLRRSAGLLRPGGVLLISTPDTGHYLRYLMRSRWPMLQPMQHLSLFSRKALAGALRAEGFETVRVETCYKTLSVDYLMNQVRPLNPVLSRMLDAVAAGVPSSVLHKYRRINIGEILAVCRRS
jgi:2-polyprenyl-3-methyl-5-hydroxy-6-metoxy-1,4-benzoquinol methylase